MWRGKLGRPAGREDGSRLRSAPPRVCLGVVPHCGSWGQGASKDSSPPFPAPSIQMGQSGAAYSSPVSSVSLCRCQEAHWTPKRLSLDGSWHVWRNALPPWHMEHSHQTPVCDRMCATVSLIL
ncbi:hypothetical protein AAFF_G00219170 [Aldrovandia affinis]|uniref:Uncharacterized protein n=1 Tax=Aldrovandia affinis TaxID=143900 RepID=A0AAD7WUU4_9TELE|nr:hypothetical protein AAFF_G00219170 [Aldrovandia affinis]